MAKSDIKENDSYNRLRKFELNILWLMNKFKRDNFVDKFLELLYKNTITFYTLQNKLIFFCVKATECKRSHVNKL